MKIPNLSKSLKTWFLIVVVAVIILILPIKIPYSVKVPGKIYPVKEWIIIKDTDGKIITTLKDYRTGLNKNYTVTQFRRGDAIKFDFSDKLAAGENIQKFDTIAAVYSNETEMRYAELMGDLSLAKASLVAQSSGDKQTLIKEEKDRLQYLRKKADDQGDLFRRTENLYKKDLISAEDYEIAKGNLNLSELDVAIAEAHIQTIQSGVKEEQLNYIRFQIKSLENQLETLHSKLQGYKILSQISGVVSRINVGDTLLTIADTSEYIVLMPIRWEDRNYIKVNQPVVFKALYSSSEENAFIKRREETVHYIRGQQFLFHLASFNSSSMNLLPGLMVECSIKCDPVSPFEFMKRVFKISN